MIGVFDSGEGGKSVLKELKNRIPNQNFIYYGDNAYCPYGDKPISYVINRSDTIVSFLVEKKVDLVVVACNTATATSIDYLRSKYKIPFVGMEPAIKPAILHSKTGVVGVLATGNTFNGRLYKSTLKKYAKDTQVLQAAGDGLVELVEANILEGPEVDALIHKYLDPMLKANADQIVLGCTHYPFLLKSFKKIAGPSVTILSSESAIARQVINKLSTLKLPDEEGRIEYFSSKEI